jgi:hypothetical protein
MYPQNAARPSLRVGDELRIPGLPIHAMIYVGPLGAHGEDVLDAPKNGEARAAMCFIPHLGDEQLFFSMKKLDINIYCPQTSKTGRHI